MLIFKNKKSCDFGRTQFAEICQEKIFINDSVSYHAKIYKITYMGL